MEELLKAHNELMSYIVKALDGIIEGQEAQVKQLKVLKETLENASTNA